MSRAVNLHHSGSNADLCMFVYSVQVCLEQSIFIILAQIFKQSVRNKSAVSEHSESNQRNIREHSESTQSIKIRANTVGAFVTLAVTKLQFWKDLSIKDLKFLMKTKCQCIEVQNPLSWISIGNLVCNHTSSVVYSFLKVLGNWITFIFKYFY